MCHQITCTKCEYDTSENRVKCGRIKWGIFWLLGFRKFLPKFQLLKTLYSTIPNREKFVSIKNLTVFFCNKALSLMSQELCVIRLFEIIKTLNQSSNITKFRPKITEFGLWWSNSLKISLFWSIRLLRSKTWVYRIWRLSRNLIFIVQNRQKLRNAKIDF